MILKNCVDGLCEFVLILLISHLSWAGRIKNILWLLVPTLEGEWSAAVSNFLRLGIKTYS